MGDIEIDDELILSKFSEAKARGARRVGFQTRQAAMDSIVDGDGPSSPGQPPHSHTGTLKRFIQYVYDPASSTLVVGPKLLTKRSRDAAYATERGGQATDVKQRIVRVPARPFMSPAFANVTSSSVPGVFANTFRN